jgi:hypothetical protein
MAKKRKSKTPGKRTLRRKQYEADESIAGYRALAKRYDVTTKTIQDWINKGLPHHGPTRARTFIPSETDPWINAFRENNSEESNRALQAKLKKLEADARRSNCIAERQEREEELAKGNLIPRDEYELAMIEHITIARDQILTLPKLLARIVPKRYHKKLLSEGDRKIRNVLEQLSKGFERIKTEGPD